MLIGYFVMSRRNFYFEEYENWLAEVSIFFHCQENTSR